MRILELTGEPIGTGGQEDVIIQSASTYWFDWFADRLAYSLLLWEWYLSKKVEDKGGRTILL